jgi:N-acetyl-beta-hexosaminidase
MGIACRQHQGVPNPLEPKTYDLIQGLYEEMVQVFPDQYFHSGGDEFNMDCWNSNTSQPLLATPVVCARPNSALAHVALRSYFAKTGDPRGRKLVAKMVDVGHDVLRKNGKIPIVWEVRYDDIRDQMTFTDKG